MVLERRLRTDDITVLLGDGKRRAFVGVDPADSFDDVLSEV